MYKIYTNTGRKIKAIQLVCVEPGFAYPRGKNKLITCCYHEHEMENEHLWDKTKLEYTVWTADNKTKQITHTWPQITQHSANMLQVMPYFSFHNSVNHKIDCVGIFMPNISTFRDIARKSFP